VVRLAEVAIEAVSSDVLSEAEVGGIAGLVWLGKRFREPVGDAADDLADAGLRDFQIVGCLTGAGEFEDDALVGEQVARGGRERGDGWGLEGGGHGGIGARVCSICIVFGDFAQLDRGSQQVGEKLDDVDRLAVRHWNGWDADASSRFNTEAQRR
jgi:hypothetical protein